MKLIFKQVATTCMASHLTCVILFLYCLHSSTKQALHNMLLQKFMDFDRLLILF